MRDIELRTWGQVRDAFRSKDLRQAGYREGAVVTADTLLDLHGHEHRERRRVENRLFRRETFAHWEHQVLGATIEATLRPFVDAGQGDLAQIGYRAAINLTAAIAGIDHDPADADGSDQLYALVKKFSEGATLMHSTRDKQAVRAEVRDAMAAFRTSFYEPALAVRQQRVEDVDRAQSGTDELPRDELPRDVLTTLLRNQHRLELEPEVMFREICFYLQAGAHSTANAFTHTVDDLLSWNESDPQRLASADLALVQRCVHESLRLSPASPVAYRSPLIDVTLSDGTQLPQGSLVVLNLTAANTDPAIFGETGDRYDPYRAVPEGVPRWGMSFGAGMHACVGAELDGGLEVVDQPDGNHLYGTVAVMAHAFVVAGGRRDLANPPQVDAASTRRHFGAYPVIFE